MIYSSIKSAVLRWTGHAACMRELSCPCKISVGKPEGDETKFMGLWIGTSGGVL